MDSRRSDTYLRDRQEQRISKTAHHAFLVALLGLDYMLARSGALSDPYIAANNRPLCYRYAPEHCRVTVDYHIILKNRVARYSLYRIAV